jgi:hypothetical protein
MQERITHAMQPKRYMGESLACGAARLGRGEAQCNADRVRLGDQMGAHGCTIRVLNIHVLWGIQTPHLYPTKIHGYY